MMHIIRFGLTFFAACIAAASAASAQPRPQNGAEFPAAQFDSLDRIAFYLWQYDSFAWATSDKLAAEAGTLGKAITDRLGSEWFCFKRDSVWHAVYGRYDPQTDTYDAAVHYVSTSGNKIVRTDAPIDASLGNRFGRAIYLAGQRLPQPLRSSNLRFNSYIRERADDGIDVWLVPAWQSNGWILYGVDFQYTLDREGRTVRDSVVRLGDIKGARPDSTATVQLVHPNAPGIPTVAELLFIHLYTKYFAHVRVITRDWVSELFHRRGVPSAWIHALREASPTTAKQ